MTGRLLSFLAIVLTALALCLATASALTQRI
jgi:hypothetical protein